MSQEMAEALGLDLNGSKSTAFGIGGKVDCVNSKVNISIQKGHEHYNVTVPVKVILVRDLQFPPLLGRLGFFDEFEITFNDHKKKMILKKIDVVNRRFDKEK
jgi:hypothetical protein